MSLIKLFNNECPICFTKNLNWHYNANLSEVDVFKCNHFTCKNCYQKLKYDFNCPICRAEGQFYLKTFGVINEKPWNTLDEWKNDFSSFLPHSINCDINRIPKSSFGVVYSNLMLLAQNYIKNKKMKKLENKKLAEKKEKRKAKALDKQNTVCSKCGTQCTSTIQLRKHINRAKCIKLQLKKN